jgi:hypothetical protein
MNFDQRSQKEVPAVLAFAVAALLFMSFAWISCDPGGIATISGGLGAGGGPASSSSSTTGTGGPASSSSATTGTGGLGGLGGDGGIGGLGGDGGIGGLGGAGGIGGLGGSGGVGGLGGAGGAPISLQTVDLGAAAPYAILAFNTVTNVISPGTIVTGDLGISPGAALTGFPPGQVVGTMHLGDPEAALAKLALLAAYNDAAGRLGAAVLPGDLSGLTFTPGLYKNDTSVMLLAGNVTLDAQGDDSAVFIFQIGSTLTTSPGTQVILSGGAKAANIFWAVGTSATLGTTSIFKGTILAASAITMNTGAAIEGRLLAQGAAVALDTNVITVPAP